MTLNNLANLCLKLNDIPKALNYLSEAEKISIEGSKTNLAVTYINLSAFLTLTSKHLEAIENLLKAVKLLKEAPNLTKNVITALVIGLHNLSLVYWQVGNKTDGSGYCKESWEMSLQHFGPDHYLTQKIFQWLNGMNSSSFTHVKIIKNADIQKSLYKEDRNTELPIYSKKRKNSDDANELKSIRFLTGERLQPMYKTKVYRKVRTRPGSRTANTTSKALKQKTLLSHPVENSKNNEKLDNYIESLRAKIETKKEEYLPLKALAEDSEEYISSKTSINESKLKNFKLVEEAQQNAARKIQRVVRGWNGRKKAKVAGVKQRQAAQAIVGAFKGFMGKIAVKKKWEELATIEEEHLDEEKEDEEVKEEKTMPPEKAAIKIQAAFHKYSERKKFKKLKISAIKIQSLVRMWLVRIIYKDILKAIILIQRAYRAHRLKKQNKTSEVN